MQARTSWDIWRERTVYALLFLMPVAGISVRHWISATFAVLVLLSLPDALRRRPGLTDSERRLFIIVAAFFGVFVITALANGWTELQTRYLGRELRFLLLIPIYLMVRRYPDAGLWLLRGGVAGGFALLAQALYDVQVMGLPRAQGIYSPNLLGPCAAMIAVFMLVLWRIDRASRWLRYAIALSAPAALGAVALSVSRGAYVGLFGMLLAWAAMSFRSRYFAVAAAGIIGLVLVGYFGSDHVRRGVDAAMTELEFVAENGGIAGPNHRLGSVSARIEMWHASLLVFRDNPILGVGRGNYREAARKYVEQGEVHPDVMQYDHPHNAYLEMLTSKGIAGLLALLALLFYPLAFFVRTRHRSPETAALGAVLITGFALFSLTDASTYIKGNFISVFVTYLVVLFSWHARALRKPEA